MNRERSFTDRFLFWTVLLGMLIGAMAIVVKGVLASTPFEWIILIGLSTILLIYFTIRHNSGWGM